MIAPKEKIEGILIDFDGVISENSLELTLKFAHDYLTQYVCIDFLTICHFYKSINSFNMKEGLSLLFSSFGLEKFLTDFLIRLQQLKSYNNQDINIRTDFLPFIANCKKNKIKFQLYSLASNQKIYNFFDSSFKISPIRSKTNIDEIKKVINLLDPPSASNWLVIDDDPLSLVFAKNAGLKTAWMPSYLFKTEDYQLYKPFIDNCIKNFDDLNRILFN